MALECGIVGLPNVGKSTIFSALTAAPAAAENFPFCTIDPNIGIVDLPDERLDFIASVFQPKKKTLHHKRVKVNHTKITIAPLLNHLGRKVDGVHRERVVQRKGMPRVEHTNMAFGKNLFKIHPAHAAALKIAVGHL